MNNQNDKTFIILIPKERSSFISLYGTSPVEYLNFDLIHSVEHVKKLLALNNLNILHKLVYTIVDIQHFTLSDVLNLIFKESIETINHIMNNTYLAKHKTILELLIINYNISFVSTILDNDYADLFFGFSKTQNFDLKVRVLLTAFKKIIKPQNDVSSHSLVPSNINTSVQIFLQLVSKFNQIYNQFSTKKIINMKYAPYKHINLNAAIANTLDFIFCILVRSKEDMIGMSTLSVVSFMEAVLSKMCYIVHDQNFYYCLKDAQMIGDKNIQNVFKNAGIKLPIIHKVIKKGKKKH